MFWSHVVNCARNHGRRAFSRYFRILNSCYAEVYKLDVLFAFAERLQHYIFRLEVAVIYASVMRAGECLTNLAYNLRDVIEAHTFRLHHRAQNLALYILHDEVGSPAGQLACLKNADDARMIHTRKRFNLLAKLLLHPPVRIGFKDMLKQNFDDDSLAHQLLVAR